MVADDEADTDAIGGRTIHHRKFEPEAEQANQHLLRLVANLENCEVTDLPPLYNRIDDMMKGLFTSPPPPEAQARIQFSYYGYRIDVDQSGHVELVKLADRSPAEVETESAGNESAGSSSPDDEPAEIEDE